ncbi:MAG: geranylgeranyl reductase family protein [Thermodesulfobacteriota bacterium]
MPEGALTVDVLVVGGGPAGARAGAAAARAGARALVVERKRRGGALPHCAEFVPRLIALEAPVPGRARAQAVEGMQTGLAGVDRYSPGPGWVLDRQVFDYALLEDAAQAGAEVWAASRLKGRENGRWLVERAGQTVTVIAGAVVAADGAASAVAGLMGWPRQPLLAGVQYTVPLLKPMERTQVWLDPAYRHGYAWLFPRGASANLGLGCRVQAKPRRLLNDLRERLVGQGLIGPGVLALGGGAIPVGGPRSELVRGDVLLAGDAAGLTHPVSGAGIPQAVFSGAEAGAAAAALAGGDHAAGDAYAQAIDLRYGRSLAAGLAARRRQEAEWDGPDFAGLMAATWPAWSGGARRGR